MRAWRYLTWSMNVHLAIWVSVAQFLERLTCPKKVAGSITVRGLEIVSLRTDWRTFIDHLLWKYCCEGVICFLGNKNFSQRIKVNLFASGLRFLFRKHCFFVCPPEKQCCRVPRASLYCFRHFVCFYLTWRAPRDCDSILTYPVCEFFSQNTSWFSHVRETLQGNDVSLFAQDLPSVVLWILWLGDFSWVS